MFFNVVTIIVLNVVWILLHLWTSQKELVPDLQYKYFFLLARNLIFDNDLTILCVDIPTILRKMFANAQ